MRKKKWMVRIVLCIFVLNLALSGGMLFGKSRTKAEEPSQVIRIGYMDYNGFITQNQDGSFSGYCVDYLNEISDYTGWKYEFVYGTWGELLDKLRNKEIDYLCSAQYTKDREQDFSYSKFPIGYTKGILYGKKDSDIAYEDYENLDKSI